MRRHCLWTGILLLAAAPLFAQDKKPPVTVSGTAGITYEHYGLSRDPVGWNGYLPRRPWNQVRLTFMPNFQFGKNFSLPFNVNMAMVPTNFAGPYSGFIPGGPKQSFKQWLTNPVNNMAVNPTYKWAELQLGTQYLNYSNLSTGDIAVFGAGFDLRPESYRIKFFTGVSQPGINYFAGPPAITGAYKRNNWMFSIGKAKEGKYELAYNLVKGKDRIGSVTSPPLTIRPQEGFTMSLISKIFFEKGWYVSAEGAQSYYTKNLLLPIDSTKQSFKPFIEAHTSTVRDYAADAAVGKKTANFDIGARVKYLGAGFQTPGFPFLQPDRFDYMLTTRFNAMKNKGGGYKMNVVASLGQRVNNVSSTTLRAKQFIGNLNWFTQFNEHWNLNVSFNNFGFQAPGGINPYGVKNVSNDLGINPTYTWQNEKAIHLLGLNYNYSKYDERDVITGNTTSNNTHTMLLTYVPTFLKKNLSPDLSVLYFLNKLPGFKFTLLTVSSSLSMQANKNRIRLRGQIQYNYSKNNSYTANGNIIASGNMDWKLSPSFTWNLYACSNRFRYGNEVTPNNARYMESTVRTGLQYRFSAAKPKKQ